MSIINCIQAAKKEIPDFSEKELQYYIGQVKYLTKDGISYEEAIKQVNDSLAQQALDEAASIEKSESIIKNISDKLEKDESLKLKDIIIRSPTRRGQLSNNVESSVKSLKNDLNSTFFKDMDDESFYKMMSGDYDQLIAQAFDNQKGDAFSKDMANRIKNLLDRTQYQLLKTGAFKLSEFHPKRLFKAVHDRSKLLGYRNGLIKNSINYMNSKLKGKSVPISTLRDQWEKAIMDNIDVEATFSKTDAVDEDGNIDFNKVSAINKKIFRNIVNSKSDILVNNELPSKISDIKKMSEMFYIWKDMQSFLNYSKMYGKGTLFNNVLSEINRVSLRSGLCSIFGRFPDFSFNKIKENILDRDTNQSRSPVWYMSADNAFRFAKGEFTEPKNASLASFGSNLRALTGAAKNGGLLINSLSDANIAASYASQFLGENYFVSFKEAIQGLVTQYGEDGKQISKMLHLGLKHEIGYNARFIDANSMTDLGSKFTKIFYKFTGMTAKDNGHIVGVLSHVAKTFWNDREKSFKSLNESKQNWLSKLDISPADWDVYRKNMSNGYMLLDLMDKVSDEDLKDLKLKTGTDQSLADIRMDLYRKLHSLFDISADHAILNPAWHEQLLMTGATRPGTAAGELMRTFMQFKGFLFSAINRFFLAPYQNAKGVGAKSLVTLENFVYMIPLSYLSYFLYNLSQGKTTPSPQDMSLSDMLGIVAPAYGTLARVLDPKNENSSLVLSFLNSPSIAALGDSFSVPLRALHGDFAGSGKELGKTASDFLPISNIPLINPYLRYVLQQNMYLGNGQEALPGFPNRGQ